MIFHLRSPHLVQFIFYIFYRIKKHMIGVIKLLRQTLSSLGFIFMTASKSRGPTSKKSRPLRKSRPLTHGLTPIGKSRKQNPYIGLKPSVIYGKKIQAKSSVPGHNFDFLDASPSVIFGKKFTHMRPRIIHVHSNRHIFVTVQLSCVGKKVWSMMDSELA